MEPSPDLVCPPVLAAFANMLCAQHSSLAARPSVRLGRSTTYVPLIRFAMVGCCSSRPVDPQEDTLSRARPASKLRCRSTECSPALHLGAPLDTFQEGIVPR